jgi:hypothetical protein
VYGWHAAGTIPSTKLRGSKFSSSMLLFSKLKLLSQKNSRADIKKLRYYAVSLLVLEVTYFNNAVIVSA